MVAECVSRGIVHYTWTTESVWLEDGNRWRRWQVGFVSFIRPMSELEPTVQYGIYCIPSRGWRCEYWALFCGFAREVRKKHEHFRAGADDSKSVLIACTSTRGSAWQL